MPRAGLDTDTLINAAAEIADHSGWETLTFAALAQKLGVRSPSLYNHIGGLPELKRELSVYSMKKFGDILKKAVAGLTGNEAIYALSDAYLEFARIHPGLYEATVRSQNDSAIQAAGKESIALILEAISPYGLDEANAIHIVRGLRSLLHGFASLQSSGGFGIPLAAEESLRTALDIYLRGIKQMSSEDY